MTDLRQAATLALEALEDERYVSARIVDAITALKAALEQPEQEPSQWRDMVVVNLVREGINKHKARELADHFTTPPAAQPEQEPVAWQYKTVEAGVFVSDQHPPDVEVWNDIEWSKPLYTTPPAAERPWVGLTDEDMKDPQTHIFDFIYGARWAEAKLKERNT